MAAGVVKRVFGGIGVVAFCVAGMLAADADRAPEPESKQTPTAEEPLSSKTPTRQSIAGLWKGTPTGEESKFKTEEARLAEGKNLVDGICFWCHEPDLMYPKHFTSDEWASLISGMIYEGAPVTEDEFDMIVLYLSKTFGPVEAAQ